MKYRDQLLLASEYGFRPYDTLPDIADPNWEPEPLLVTRNISNQLLLAVGVKHRTQPGSETKQYNAVREGFSYFELATRGLTRVVVVEGGTRTIVDDPDEAYRQGSESSMTASLAAQHDIKQCSFEPDCYATKHLLDQGLLRRHVALYLTVRLLPVWSRRINATGPSKWISFENWVKPRLRLLRTEIGWEEFSSYASIEQLYKEHYGSPFTPDDPVTIQYMLRETVGYMYAPVSPVHEVAIAANKQRDVCLALGIASLWQAGYSAFVPYGYSHIDTLQDFIRGLKPRDA
jgi:hypothetical protein